MTLPAGKKLNNLLQGYLYSTHCENGDDKSTEKNVNCIYLVDKVKNSRKKLFKKQKKKNNNI